MRKKPIALRKAAEWIGFSLRTLYREIDDGRLPKPIKLRGRSYLFEQDIEKYLSSIERRYR